MFEVILNRDLVIREGVALTVAVLLVVLRGWHPVAERHRLRLPVGLLLVHVAVVGVLLVFEPAGDLGELVEAVALFLLLAAFGRGGFLLVMDCLLGPKVVRPLPKIFREILQGLVYAAVLLLTLRSSGVDPTSLLTTSALLTAIVGLSLQDTLGNLFAGLAIQAEHPFEIGDWIRFGDDPHHIGKVVEINWRATKLVTIENVLVVVPNGVLAKSPLANFDKPSRPSMRGVEVFAPVVVPPQRVRDLLLAAIRGVDGVLDDPSPSVLTRAFSERGVSYQLRYFIADFAAQLVIEGAVRERAWYALQRAGVAIPPPQRDLRLWEQSASASARDAQEAQELRRRALAQIDFLASLPPDLQDSLAARTHTRLYAAGEYVFRQGEVGDELYILERGEVLVLVERRGGPPVELTRLGPGKFFGEVSMLIDSRRHATVRALAECEVLVVEKQVLQQILDRAPRLAEEIQRTLDERQRMLQLLGAEAERLPEDSARAPQGPLLGRIRDFFSI